MRRRRWCSSFRPVISADTLVERARLIPSADARRRPHNLALNNARNPDYAGSEIRGLHRHTAYRTPQPPKTGNTTLTGSILESRAHLKGEDLAFIQPSGRGEALLCRANDYVARQ